MAIEPKQTLMGALYEEAISRDQEPMFLLDFFGKSPEEIHIGATRRVRIDVIRAGKKVAADVVPGSGRGNPNKTTRYTATEYDLPLFWEEAHITANDLLAAFPGDDPYAPMSQEQKMRIQTAREQKAMHGKIRRAMAKMAADALTTGKVTLTNSDTIDFKKKSTLTATPRPNFASATGDPFKAITDMATKIHQAGKMRPNVAMFGVKAFDAFRGNAKVKADFDNRRTDPGYIRPEEMRMGASMQGRLRVGDVALDMYVFSDSYENSSGTDTPYIPDDIIILLNSTARLDVAYGAVDVLPQYVSQYEDMGFPSPPEFVRGMTVPFAYNQPPSGAVVGVQAAPLVIPVAIDTIGTITNVV